MGLLDDFTKRAFKNPLKRGIQSIKQGIEDRIENGVTDAFNSIVRDLSQNAQGDLISRLGDGIKKELSGTIYGSSSSEISRATKEDICDAFLPKALETSSEVTGRINNTLGADDLGAKIGISGETDKMKPILQYPENIGKYYVSLKFRKYSRPNVFQQAKLEFRNAIALPIPRNLADNISLDIQNNQAAGATGIVLDAVLNIDADGQNLQGMVSSQVGALAFSYLSSLIDDKNAGLLGQAAGAVPNPHLQTFFKGVNMREHSFEWTFAPRNAKESVTIQNIILRLKQNSLPAFSSTGFAAFQYPYLCMIDLHPWDQAAPLIKFKPTLLKNVSVNYAPNGIPSFFAGTTLPTSISLRLDFVETEYFTADDFGRSTKEGYDSDGIAQLIKEGGRVLEALGVSQSFSDIQTEVSDALNGREEAASTAAGTGDRTQGDSAAAAKTAARPDVTRPPAASRPTNASPQKKAEIEALNTGQALTFNKSEGGLTRQFTVRRLSQPDANGNQFETTIRYLNSSQPPVTVRGETAESAYQQLRGREAF